MDPLYKAISYFRVKKYQQSIDICTECLQKNPYDQAFWTLKMRCLVEQIYVDDLEADEDGIAESLMDENSISQVSRPGTSLKTSLNSNQLATPSSSQAIRPVTQSGRPISGILRPGTQSGRATSLDQALRTPRTARTARPLTSHMGRSMRLGTASMLSNQNEEFIDLNRLNLSKYALLPHLNKPLYEYMLYIGNDVRSALNFAAQCTEQAKFKSWWWKKELGKCYLKMNLLRDAEKQFRSALNHSECGVETYLWLGKIYLRLDQPLNALKIYEEGFDAFPGETVLKCYSARVYEALNDLENSSKHYKEVLMNYEPTNCEAIACIAMHHFYNDQPELALRYYRHILQMGTCSAEIYNNIALCCFYTQQFDMVITCFERALMNSDSDEITADCWYNCGLVVLATGDKQLAMQCFKLALVTNNEHAEAYNNLGVIEMMMANSRNQNNPSIDQIQKSKSLFQTASSLAPHLYEPNYNLALIGERNGQYDLCYEYVKKATQIYPEHYSSQQLFQKMKKLYENF